ncbi:MAG: NADH-dependent phenylglyoxylate dehydrogenase subunit epsilon [Pseudolabrys sp.]|jgi:phenylglyoxylate dehydrogenase epsilon subunit
MDSKYLIVGSSHAALEAAAAIRMIDSRGTLTLLTRDAHLPYSPTILPYVVSGRSQPDNVQLRDAAYFRANAIDFVSGTEVVSLDPTQSILRLACGEHWQFERLLIASGAAPGLPKVAGLSDVPFHVLRSLDDAVGLRQAMQRAKSALVLGAGLIGMHVAENMAKAGIKVTVVELQPFALSSYFEPKASAIIERAFSEHGVRMLMGRTLASVSRASEGITATLDDNSIVAADLLLVCTGVKPNIGFLSGSGIDTETGVLVDDRMRTNVASIWAAGDVAQARGFWGDKVINGILPNAVEQGRIAGADMVEDTGVQPFSGAVPLNTYSFFGQQAISVGRSGGPGSEVAERNGDGSYRHIVLKDGRLVGISTINDFVDAGIMWQLILRHTDLSAVKEAFIADPQLTGRQLMSQHWR